MGVGKETNIPGEEHGAHTAEDERGEDINQWIQELGEQSVRAQNMEWIDQEMVGNAQRYIHLTQADRA